MVRRPKPKRGIVILVVLSLLVLFVLLVVTFAIIAGQYRRAAMAYSHQETQGVQPSKDLDRAFYQILRDTRARNSVARDHSLLRDFYGEDGFTGQLAPGYYQWWINGDAAPGPTAPSPPTAQLPPATSQTLGRRLSGGQFVDLVVFVPPTGVPSLTSTDGQSYRISQIPGYYNGCVLTVTSGVAQGASMRIVGYAYLSGVPVFRVLAPKSDKGTQITPAELGGNGRASFVVNGRPFSGTGFGYQPPVAITGPTTLDNTIVTTSATNSVTVMAPLAPNHAGQPVIGFPMQANFLSLLGGGTDEGYDAPDNQNLALGLVMAGATKSANIIPSFHRPALVNYWINNPSAPTYWADDDFKRHVLMRPVELNFDGSNPNFDPTNQKWYVTGPWDVDNDGDGIADSVWVDMGLPVQTTPDGRKYKPLFAVLCIDLDGRLNVNAHGRLAVVTNPIAVGLARNTSTDPPRTTQTAPLLPKGLGYGPAEIDLGTSLAGLVTDRYGPDGHPGRPGLDLLGRLKFFEEPENYFSSDPINGTGPRSSYSTHADLRAELAFGLNDFGQPVSEELLPALLETRGDSHYEMNLVEPDGTDQPFTEGDLEQVLRRYDYDVAMLSDRLSSYFPNLKTAGNQDARIITTTSFDAPVPGVTVPGELAEAVRYAQQDPSNPLYKGNHLKSASGFLDLLAVRLLAGGVTTANLSAEIAKMVPTDVRMGLRMDLNRPIGNGRDMAAPAENGVCDEFGEQFGEQVYNDVGTSRAEYQQVDMWHSNGTDVNSDGTPPYAALPDPKLVLDNLLARQLLARHLYVMMMTLIDHGHVDRPDPTQDPITGKTIADIVAQWAVNVVDFRDADSIMTAFEYDRNPFDGWNADGATREVIDGDPTTVEIGIDRGVVWGCERPELLLTEAVGFHARRTTDSASDNGIDEDLANNDPNYDQKHLPFATAFVEMYNPWSGWDTTNTHNSGKTPPRELYGATAGVRLNATTPSGHPVWRLIVVNRTDSPTILLNSFDPDGPSVDWTNNPANRAVYFIDNAANLPPVGTMHGRRQFYTNQTVNPILPGQFAVVGGGFANGNTWVSPLGDINPSSLIKDQQRIVLTPNANSIDYYPGNGAAVQHTQAVAIVPNLSRSVAGTGAINYIGSSFNVSEPTAGYPIVSGLSQFNAAAFPNPPVQYAYNAVYEDAVAIGSPLPLDNPLDLSSSESFAVEVGATDGTNRTFSRVYLQRLANPMADYSSQGNPYRTLDSISMDLTVCNGRERFEDPADPELVATPGLDFTCLQRGDADDRTLADQTEDRRLWRQEPARTAAPVAAGARTLPPDFYFPYQLNPAPSTQLNSTTYTLGARNTKYRDQFPPPAQNLTYPWLVWNNRPYISQYELMQVPRYNSWELLKNFSLPNGSSPYNGSIPPYGHLANFFHANSSNGIQPQHIYRIFEYVHVPSRFVGTETFLNPNYFGKTFNISQQPNGVSMGFLPPFNRISAYREPGRINLNTTTSATVWNALPGNRGPLFTSLVDSVWTAVGGVPTLDPNIPTYFEQPFRPASSPLRPHEIGTTPTGIDSTLLRNADGSTLPLMEDSNAATALVARHPRNSYFRYEQLQKMGNTTTSRSNVYAIWITVGYFEVEPNRNATGAVTYDAFHPDGFRVAQEVGLDTGEIQRHRAFYIVDRTIPVAFEPGQNHNVDRCVLLRRYIE